MTCVLIVQWVNRYVLDEDISVVETTPYFEKEDDIFPVLTTCFKQTFRKALFKKLNYAVSGSDYKKFLSGRYFNQEMISLKWLMIFINYGTLLNHIFSDITIAKVMVVNGQIF